MSDDEWQTATKKPVEVEFRGPYTDTETIETIEGDFEVDEEYILDHGGYVIIRGVEGEEYPCGLDIFRETYETDGDTVPTWPNDSPAYSSDEKSLDEVYRDRNLLACAVANLLHPQAGWTPAPDEDGDEWAIVYAETPLGQMSWHVPREMAESLVPRNDRYEYDGHDRETKNDRLSAWCDEGCWY